MTEAHDHLPSRNAQYQVIQSAKRVRAGGDVTQIVNIGIGPPYLLTGFDGTAVALSPVRAVELPSRLLRARYEAIDFVGRETELAELSNWCASSDGLSVVLIHGPGGQGKTRLLRRFAASQAQSGWTIWQAYHEMDAEVISETENTPAKPSGSGLLVIADYAERWPVADLRELVRDTRGRSNTGPVRLLIAARPAGIWWRSLRNWLKEELRVPATTIELSPLGRQVPRKDLFTTAVGQFAEILGISGVDQLEPPASLDQEGADQVLAVHMAALAAVDAHRHRIPAPVDLPRVSAYLLHREYTHWEKLHTRERDPILTSPKAMSRAVFVATLAGPLSGDRRWDYGADILLAARVTASRDKADSILTDHDLCYPCPTGDALLQPLYPDRLGEDFLALAVPGHGLEVDYPTEPWATEAATRLTTPGPEFEPSPAQIRKTVTVLTAAAERWPHLRRTLTDLLHASPELAIAGGGVALPALAQMRDFDTSVLAVIEQLLPDRSDNLDIGHAALAQRLTIESLDTTNDPAKRALLYLELGKRFSNAADREEAVVAIRHAVEIYRRLAEANPIHESDLAVSLKDLGGCLAEAGEWEEALKMTTQAVEIYTRLTNAAPGVHEFGLALSLDNLCDELTQIGRQKEALDTREKAVEVYRHLAAVNPITHEPSLVISLNDLNGRLSEARRWDEALEAAKQAANICSRLTHADQAAYGPILNNLLDSHRNWLKEIDQWKDALKAAMEALSSNGLLTDADSASYDPKLVKSLKNLDVTLSGLKYLGKTMELAEQAAGIYRQLTEADPPTRQSDLAMQLNDLVEHLSKVSRRAEKLSAVGEIGPIERQSAEATLENLTQPDVTGANSAEFAPSSPSMGEPLNCSVLFTDVAGLGNPNRTDADRDAVRIALYTILQESLDASGVPWAECYHEDRGDGVIVVIPPTISTRRVVDPLIPVLAARLRQYNRRSSDVVQIQLRAALHAGPVGKDAEGLTGRAIISTARILDARVIKDRLAAEQADLIFAVSDYVYEHVMPSLDGLVDVTTFTHVEDQVKESRISAWIRLDGPAPALHGYEDLPRSTLRARRAAEGEQRANGRTSPPEGREPSVSVVAPLRKLPAEVRGRDGLLEELRRALRPYPWRASRAFVIAGMAGLGKSTIALAAAKLAEDLGYRVWWVGATDSALLTSGMLEVLRELDAPESVLAPVREGARTAAARAWAFLNGEHLGGRRWLLVFDGADNPSILGAAGAPVPIEHAGWLRTDPAGMLIVTTRNRDPDVWGTGITLRELKPLDDEASARVLQDLAPEVADPGGRQARELSRRLGGLPLALHLAGAYLGSPFARWSTFEDYRQALDSVELPEVLADIEDPSADIHDSALRTWDLSLDALAAEGRPQARPLLLVLSCFAPATPIPAWLLQATPLADLLARHLGPAASQHGSNKDAGRRVLREALQGLSHIGLIEISNGGGPAGLNAVTVHPVVADANRSRLATIEAAERAGVQGTAVAQLEAAAAGLAPARPGDWPAWRLLVPHLNAVIDLLAGNLPPAVLTGLLAVSAAGTEALLDAGRLAAAGKLAQASVAAASFLSRDDPVALAARGALADTLVRRGRSGEAEALYRELLADRCRVQGDDHLDTLATRHDLAAAIGMQGRYGEAEELYRGLLDDDYRLLGPDQRDTLAARSSLARMIGLQGRYADAQELGNVVLADQRRVLGERDPDTLTTRQNLARVTGKAGRYAEAERLYRGVLADRRQVLGSDHPDTLSTRHRLAQMIAMPQGGRLGRLIGWHDRYGEATEIVNRVLGGRREILGDDHPDTLAAQETLAWLTELKGHNSDAERQYRGVLADRQRVLGASHPDTLVAWHAVGRMLGVRQRYADAEQVCRAVLEARRRVLGDDHPDTLTSRDMLAMLTARQGRRTEARELACQVLADRSRVLGPDHPETRAARANLDRLTG